MSDEPDNLVEFVRPDNQPTVNLMPHAMQAPSCNHDNAWVDENNRSVECKACHAKLDAFDVLAKIAHESANWMVRNRARDSAEVAMQSLLYRRAPHEREYTPASVSISRSGITVRIDGVPITTQASGPRIPLLVELIEKAMRQHEWREKKKQEGS